MIGEKIPRAFRGVMVVLSKPGYLLAAIGLAFLFALLIFFFINIGFYWPLISSSLPILDKLRVIGEMILQMSTEIVTTLNGALLLVVAILQGVAFSTMIFVMKRNRKVDTAMVGRNGAAMFAAALGLGCVPCGTSLIMPIVTLLFSSSAYAAANMASLVVLVLAFFLSLYSLYSLGNVAYMHDELEKVKQEIKNGAK